MTVLFATVADLIHFAFGAFAPSSNQHHKETYAVALADSEAEVAAVVYNRAEPSESQSERAVKKNTIMYVGSIDVPLYYQPTREFDGQIMKLSYGTMTMVLGQVGRWAEVVVGELSGWVLSEDLTGISADVYPQFIIGEANRADDPNTVRLRAVINDQFGGGEVESELSAAEYVTYRVMKKGRKLPWSTVRPRTPGRWHQLLKRRGGVKIGIKPKADAIMEFTLEDGTGHLAYVDAVGEGDTLSISEANWPHDGIYNERILTKEEWLELKPVFISLA